MKFIRHIALLIGCCGFAAAGESVSSPMVPIPGGAYQRPLEKGGVQRAVKDYQIDTRQVTNAEFLTFVKANPAWQRSQVNALFADKGYLTKWAGDTELGRMRRPPHRWFAFPGMPPAPI